MPNTSGIAGRIAGGLSMPTHLIGFGAFTPASGGLDGSESDGTQLFSGDASFSSGWTAIAATFTADAVQAPNGATEAGSLVGGGTDDRHGYYQRTVVSTDYRFSVYAKQNTLRYFQLFAVDTNSAWVYADLQTGTITDSGDSGSTLNLVSSAIEAGANGFYKISMTLNDAGPTDTYFQLMLSDRSTHTAPLSSGSPQFTTSSGIYLWRPKVVNV